MKGGLPFVGIRAYARQARRSEAESSLKALAQNIVTDFKNGVNISRYKGMAQIVETLSVPF